MAGAVIVAKDVPGVLGAVAVPDSLAVNAAPSGLFEAARVSGPTGPAAQYERLASGMLS